MDCIIRSCIVVAGIFFIHVGVVVDIVEVADIAIFTISGAQFVVICLRYT